MCHGRALPCLRLIYNYKKSILEYFLEKDGSVPIHIINLQTLVIEMYKVVNSSSSFILNEIFESHVEGRYNLRDQKAFKIPLVNTVCDINNFIFEA